MPQKTQKTFTAEEVRDMLLSFTSSIVSMTYEPPESRSHFVNLQRKMLNEAAKIDDDLVADMAKDFGWKRK